MIKMTIGRGNAAVDISNCKVIEIHDLTNYVADSCHNGGNYAFSEQYVIESEKEVIVSYSTTAEFRYCAVNGCFCTNDCAEHCLPEGADVMAFNVLTIFELAAILGRVLTEQTCSVKKEGGVLTIEYR